MIQVCKIEKRVRAFMVTILMVTLCLYTTLLYAWTDCYSGICYECPVDWSGEYTIFEKSIVCEECYWNEEWDISPRLKNNGCTAKISKTDAKGFTSFTFTYLDSNNRKQTVKYKWQDQEGTDDFIYNGHVCSFWWDCIPFGIFLYVDGVEHAYVLKSKSSGVSIPVEWQKARTLRGLFGEGCSRGADGAEGTAQLKCGKANKKGIAKVSLSITPFNGKKRSYKSVSVDVSQGGAVKVSWPQQKYQVTVDGDSFFSEPIYGGSRPACSPNAVWSADIGGSMAGSYTMEFPYWDEVWYDDNGLIYHRYDGSYAAFMEVAAAKLWHRYGEGGYCPNGNSILFDGGYFMSSGNKWDFSSQFGDDKPPKITYNSQTGLFSGSVYLTIGPYCMDGEWEKPPPTKKVTLKIKGVYTDGVISGAVTYKNFSTPVTGGSASRR